MTEREEYDALTDELAEGCGAEELEALMAEALGDGDEEWDEEDIEMELLMEDDDDD